MIKVEIKDSSHPGWSYYGAEAYEAYIVIKLEEAGIPTIGPILDRKIDLSKGILTTFYNPYNMKTIWVEGK